MRERIDLGGYWHGRLQLNPDVDVRAPDVIEQEFYVPRPWNLQMEHIRWPSAEPELSGVVHPLQNQNFRDISRKFSEGVIEYRRAFSCSPDRIARMRAAGDRAALVFEGSNYRTTVRLNGVDIGTHDGGHLAFEFDISQALLAGENMLEVRVDNLRRREACPQEQFNWKNYGGLYRPVYIEFRASVHIISLSVQTARVAQGWTADIALTLNQPARATIQAHITSGTEEVETTSECRNERTCRWQMRMNNPTVWQPGVGGLSLLRISTVANGQTCDRQEISFGFRTVALRGPHVYINGEKTLILGAACHEQHPTFGNSLPEWQAEHDIRLMRAVGLNAVRASHYPHSQGFYRACDRLGMLVFSELPCWQFNAYHYEHDSVREFCCDYACLMVEQLGYHPSIIGWVVQCESDTHSPAAKDFFGAIARAFKTNDPTRLTMSAESAKPPEHLQTSQKKADDAPVVKETESVVQSEVDILGLNLYAAWYADKSERLPQALDAMHSSLPAKPLLISEFGAEGIPGHRSLTMEPWTEDYQAEVLCRHIRAILDRDYVTGFFLWLFMDYECSSIGILGINSKGLVTPERKPKLAFNAVRQLLVTERGVASP